MQRLPPTSVLQTAEKRKDFYSISSWAGGLLEVLFRLPPFFSPSCSLISPLFLRHPLPSTPTPPPTQIYHPPTHTPPNHFFPLFLCWKGSMTSLFLSFTFRLSVYQLILAWPPREEWKECIDVGVKTIWLCYCGNHVGEHFRGRGAQKSSWETEWDS